MTKRISIVIPNLQSPIIDETLRSIRNQSFDLSQVEVIVVGRDRYGLVREDGLVRFLDTGHPVAPAVARNLGLSQASGEIVVFTDSDCIAAQDWLANLMAAYHAEPDRTVVGGAVAFDAHNYWTLADNISTFYRFLPSREPGERLHLPSLNFSAHRQVLQAVGGFDERYPQPTGEDTDLSLRLRQAGHSVYFEPGAVVYHHPPRQSLSALLRHAWNFGRYTPRMRPEYGDLLNWPAFLRQPALVLALSPLLAAGVTTRIFVEDAELRRYWRTAPAIFLAKLAWCAGAAQQRELQVANDEPRTADGKLRTSELAPGSGIRVASVVVNWNRREDTLECLASLHNMTPPASQDCQRSLTKAPGAWSGDLHPSQSGGSPLDRRVSPTEARRARSGDLRPSHQGDLRPSWAVDVILVDNGSTDGTARAVEAWFPDTEILSLPDNLGFAAGCNVGLRRALESGADYVLLVNNAAVVAPDMLEPLVSVAETRPDAGLLGPVIYYFDRPDGVWSAGYRQRPVTLSAQPPAGRPEDGRPYEVDRLYGAGLLIRRAVLDDVGLFDERFFMYYEDADLCRRVQEAGYRLLVIPAARMWHKVSASTGEGSPAQKYHLARGSVLFFAKHTPLPLLPVIIVYRLGVALKQIALAARRRRWRVISAYLRGLWDGLRLLRTAP